MLSYIWLGIISFLIMSVLIYSHDKRRHQFEGFYAADPKADYTCPIGSKSKTEGLVCVGTDDPNCPKGQYSKATGGVCTGPALPDPDDPNVGQDALDLAGYPYGLPGKSRSEQINTPTLEIAEATRIYQPPFPPCVGYLNEVVYSPADIQTNIAQVKMDLKNLQKNIPNFINDGINQQTGILVKGILRQQGVPLTDDEYGQNDGTLSCN